MFMSSSRMTSSACGHLWDSDPGPFCTSEALSMLSCQRNEGGGAEKWGSGTRLIVACRYFFSGPNYVDVHCDVSKNRVAVASRRQLVAPRWTTILCLPPNHVSEAKNGLIRSIDRVHRQCRWAFFVVLSAISWLLAEISRLGARHNIMITLRDVVTGSKSMNGLVHWSDSCPQDWWIGYFQFIDWAKSDDFVLRAPVSFLWFS